MAVTVEQIRAARALKNWGQAELADRAGLTQVTIGNIESGKSRGSQESLASIVGALESAGIEFIESGVRLTANSTRTIDGKNAVLTLLDDVYFSLRHTSEKKEVLLFGSDERRTPPEILLSIRKLRNNGVQFRSLIAEDSTFLRGELSEYRHIPKEVLSGDAVTLYADKVAFMVEATPHYRVLLVKNAYIHNDHRRLFEYFWKTGKTPITTSASKKERYA